MERVPKKHTYLDGYMCIYKECSLNITYKLETHIFKHQIHKNIDIQLIYNGRLQDFSIES